MGAHSVDTLVHHADVSPIDGYSGYTGDCLVKNFDH